MTPSGASPAQAPVVGQREKQALTRMLPDHHRLVSILTLSKIEQFLMGLRFTVAYRRSDCGNSLRMT